MDATYRGELRELNELNFARFDAKLEPRIAELETRFERRLGEQSRWLVAIFISVIATAVALWFRR